MYVAVDLAKVVDVKFKFTKQGNSHRQLLSVHLRTGDIVEPVKATAVSTVVYGVVSCWMYLIGMGAAIITGESDIAAILLKTGLGIAGLLIIVFSTVTTTFLDAYSAGISAESLSGKISGKLVAIVVTVLLCLAASRFGAKKQAA